MRVERVERRADLGREPDGVVHRERALLGDPIPERAAVDVGDREEVMVPRDPHIEDGDEVPMPHLLRDAGLAREPPPVHRVAGQQALQHLERDERSLLGVRRLEHDAHRALPQDGIEPVRAERVAEP